MPQESQITRLIGLEGWSAIGKLATANALTAVQRKATMIAIIFEVRPAAGRKDDYLAHAQRLRADLEQIDGFISVERFQSLTDPDKMLSLSFFRDEEAVARWRNHARHRATQAAGRDGIFDDYRLRVAEVVRDYGMTERREQAPVDSRVMHEA